MYEPLHAAAGMIDTTAVGITDGGYITATVYYITAIVSVVIVLFVSDYVDSTYSKPRVSPSRDLGAY